MDKPSICAAKEGEGRLASKTRIRMRIRSFKVNSVEKDSRKKKEWGQESQSGEGTHKVLVNASQEYGQSNGVPRRVRRQ